MSWSDNFPVYLYNLSPIYIFSVIVSILAVIAAIYYQKYDEVKVSKSGVENLPEKEVCVRDKAIYKNKMLCKLKHSKISMINILILL